MTVKEVAMSVSVKGNKPKRGFFYVQGGRELFVPRKYLSRFFREWDFPTRIDDVRKMKYHLEQYVGSYNPNTSKIAFVRDEEDYMNLYLAPLNETLIDASEEFVLGASTVYDGVLQPSDWKSICSVT
tara:strand:- start:73 stop:453 length:381 start_codon:yes stop_codon:yes gene_type:complete